MAKSIRASISDEAYKALQVARGDATQGDFLTTAILALTGKDTQHAVEEIVLSVLRQAHAKLDCLLQASNIPEGDVEARLDPEAHPMTPQKFYKEWQAEERTSLMQMGSPSQTLHPNPTLFQRMRRLFIKQGTC